MKVRDLMQTTIVTLRAMDALDIAEDIMSMGRIRHLPVVQANGRLVGIVTQRDLFKASVSSVLGVSSYKERQWLSKVLVRDVMTKGVVSIEADAEVEDAIEILLRGKFGCLPVIEKKKLVGILTETDLLQYLQGLLQEAKQKPKRRTPKPRGQQRS